MMPTKMDKIIEQLDYIKGKINDDDLRNELDDTIDDLCNLTGRYNGYHIPKDEIERQLWLTKKFRRLEDRQQTKPL
jgi:hypothetical protein